MSDVIRLAHGSGGEVSRKLIEEMIGTYFKNDIIARLDDSAVISLGGIDLGEIGTGGIDLRGARIAFTTDSYVVDPIFFPGGDIGSLAVNGTVNDLSMVGAAPIAITLSLILEEGFAVTDLRRILESVMKASAEAGVAVVGGDTKVVERGSADRIFVNTSGIGAVSAGVDISSSNAKPGDIVILSGSIGDHGIAVLSRREGIDFETDIVSDTAPLNGLVKAMLGVGGTIRAMRDPTRGGLATTLNEIASRSGVGVVIEESAVPIRGPVSEACEMLGLDVFYVANEGKLVAFVGGREAGKVLETMRGTRYGEDATVIGRVVREHPGMVTLNTSVGGSRLLSPLSGELLPRIC